MDPARIRIYGIVLMRYSVPCSNFCKFCSVGFKRFDDVPLDTIATIARRFLEWKSDDPEKPGIFCTTQYTHAYMTYEQLMTLKNVSSPGKYKPLPLQLNGCRFMPEDELCAMFERHGRTGCNNYCFTICGDRKVHTYWVGRAGEYDALLRMARVAAKQGWHREEKLFLSKSSIPCLKGVMDELDMLPGERNRRIFPFMYIGNARNLEHERITYDDLSDVPKEAYAYMDLEFGRDGHGLSLKEYLSEQEWTQWFMRDYEEPVELEQCLVIRLDAESIPRLLTENCGKLYHEYLNRSLEIYEKLPLMDELCFKYGEPENQRLYTRQELERKWVQRFIHDNLWEHRGECNLSLF